MKIIPFIFAVMLMSAASAQTTRTSPATKPSTLVDAANCVTSECHANIKATPIVHGPVATNACDACHELTDVAEHKYVVRRKKAELCTFCHEFSVKSMPVIHKPVAEGECLGCHDPHGGNTHAITREQTTAALCARCHDNVSKNKHFLHSPVKQGECDSCHTPHASRFPKMLDLQGTDLCLACHKEFEPKLTSSKFQHKALQDGCLKCHDVHGSNIAMSLRAEGAELCYGCHEKTKTQVTTATVQHSVVTKDRACLSCHDPHSSNAARLMSDLPAVTCLKCHDKDVKTSNGRVVAAVPEMADPSLLKHGVVKEGQCHGCHDVHGGQRENLLTKPYTPAFYQRFAVENFDFCFSCHDKNLVQQEKTTQFTNFRNGDVNLHFIHANRGDRDKNCRACHMTHAAGNDRLIRTTLKYGVWQMPMRFVKSDTGGSCYPGCHPTYAYDRDHPLPSTTQPTTRQVTPIARAENTDTLLVQWSTADINGNPVEIPEGGHPVVLSIIRSDYAERDDLLTRINAAIPKDVAVQTVVIVCGDRATQVAKELSGKLMTTSSIIADDSSAATEALGVRGWPMVLVLRQDGYELTRLTGSAQSIALKLPEYLRLAAGKIDQADLEKRLATQPVKTDGQKELARTLRSARTLLDDGKIKQANDLLTDAQTNHPDSMELRALQVETLLKMSQPMAAEHLLNTIPDDQLAKGTTALLRAKVLITREAWATARASLEALVKELPDDPAVHDLLGKVYEHDRDFAKATEQYRLASELKGRK